MVGDGKHRKENVGQSVLLTNFEGFAFFKVLNNFSITAIDGHRGQRDATRVRPVPNIRRIESEHVPDPARRFDAIFSSAHIVGIGRRVRGRLIENQPRGVVVGLFVLGDFPKRIHATGIRIQVRVAHSTEIVQILIVGMKGKVSRPRILTVEFDTTAGLYTEHARRRRNIRTDPETLSEIIPPRDVRKIREVVERRRIANTGPSGTTALPGGHGSHIVFSIAQPNTALLGYVVGYPALHSGKLWIPQNRERLHHGSLPVDRVQPGAKGVPKSREVFANLVGRDIQKRLSHQNVARQFGEFPSIQLAPVDAGEGLAELLGLV